MRNGRSVSTNSLEEDFDGKIWHLDTPFTGTAFEVHEEKLVLESQYLHGVLHGITRRWSGNGELVDQEAYFLGIGHGECWSWYPDGQKRFYAMECLGFSIEEARWNQNGVQCFSMIAETNKSKELLRLAISRGFPVIELLPRFQLDKTPMVDRDDFRSSPGLVD